MVFGNFVLLKKVVLHGFQIRFIWKPGKSDIIYAANFDIKSISLLMINSLGSPVVRALKKKIIEKLRCQINRCFIELRRFNGRRCLNIKDTEKCSLLQQEFFLQRNSKRKFQMLCSCRTCNFESYCLHIFIISMV